MKSQWKEENGIHLLLQWSWKKTEKIPWKKPEQKDWKKLKKSLKLKISGEDWVQRTEKKETQKDVSMFQ